jgi:ribosomal-protein-alanine N-acetyltransferase
MIQWAYHEVDARDFCCNHANVNTASANVIKKCGFKFDHYGHYSRFDGSETFEATFYKMHLE